MSVRRGPCPKINAAIQSASEIRDKGQADQVQTLPRCACRVRCTRRSPVRLKAGQAPDSPHMLSTSQTLDVHLAAVGRLARLNSAAGAIESRRLRIFKLAATEYGSKYYRFIWTNERWTRRRKQDQNPSCSLSTGRLRCCDRTVEASGRCTH